VVEEDEDGKGGKKLRESNDDIGKMSQDNAVAKAEQFASSEDAKEEAEIEKAQAHEKKMEEKAKQRMYAEMQQMKTDVKKQEKDVERHVREHQETESRVLGEDKTDNSDDN